MAPIERLPGDLHVTLGTPLLTIFLFHFKIAFNQTFLTSDGNLVNSEKYLGSGIKCDTSETNYTKVRNGLFNSFTTDLKT